MDLIALVPDQCLLLPNISGTVTGVKLGHMKN